MPFIKRDDLAATRCAFIGDEPLVAQCAELAAAAGLAVVAIAAGDDRVRAWATAAGTPVIDPGIGLADALRAHDIDVLFSVANLRVLSSDVLRAVKLAINFHDGPLPEIVGVHVTTWALMGGRREHGVTWHLMTEEVDAGEIVAEERFPIADDETAYSLNARCFEAAVRSFPRVAAAVASGNVATTPQRAGTPEVSRRHRRPEGAALVNPSRTVADLVRTVRALDLGDRTINRIGRVRLVAGDNAWLVGSATAVANDALGAGRVRATDDTLLVGVADGTVRLTGLTELDGRPVAPSSVAAQIGSTIEFPARLAATLDGVDSELSRHEAASIRALTGIEAPALPFAGAGTGWGRQPLDPIPGLELSLAAATVATWVARIAGTATGAVGLVDSSVAEVLMGLSPIAAPPVLNVTVSADGDRSSVQATANAAIARGPWLLDLIARTPALHGVQAPSVVVDAGPDRAALASEALRLRLDVSTGALALEHDRARVCDDEAARAAGQLAAMLSAAVAQPNRPLALLPICGPADLELLGALAAPALEHDRSLTVWDEVREGLRRRATEPSVSAGATTLTGADVLTATERLAAALGAAGVRRGDRVGVAVGRGADLVIATLAVLASGASYVPLDPTYPEDRQRDLAADAGLAALITDNAVGMRIAPAGCTVLGCAAIAPQEAVALEPASPSDVAYVIYTSGSTGRPKGVQVEHRQVVAFFAAMDRVIPHDPPGTWLAVTSLSFDISVLELLYTLSRGFHVVVAADKAPMAAVAPGAEAVAVAATATAVRPVDMSLFYFAAASDGEGYRLLLDGARFADENGFVAVWTPERHFHAFGGPYPNPSVTGAAVAAVTKNVSIRAGSVVLPLHSPLRVAEEWSVVDNISGGRAGISVASGWQPHDFVLKPENFANAKQIMIDNVDTIRRLWRGEKIEFTGHDGKPVAVSTLPRPVQAELPMWITAAGNPATFEIAGELGAGVLTHLLGQRPEVLASNIEIYRAAWRKAGHTGDGHIVLMVHTFVGLDAAAVRALVRDPLAEYLQTSVSLIKDVASTFPTFAGRHSDADDIFASLTPEEMAQLLDAAVDRYCETSGLIGTPDTVLDHARRFAALGVDELACLIDFGVGTSEVLAALPLLAEIRATLATSSAEVDGLPVTHTATSARAGAETVAELVTLHGVTHLQCTPSQAAMLAADPADRAALGKLKHLMVGGEAFPAALAAELRALVPGRITNMYGPTETTIWSLTYELTEAPSGVVPIGRPIAGTTVAIVDERLQPVPPGTAGELVIGGDGVTRGYHERPELTAERFTEIGGLGRAYRTGDLARVSLTGEIEFLGRNDFQVKLRGHRIELGEIETVIARHPDVAQAIVTAHGSGVDTRLVAYVTAANGRRPEEEELREHVARTLPEIMVPARAVVLDTFPLTPNGKVDRKALPAPAAVATSAAPAAPLDDEYEQFVANIWAEVLERSAGRDDNFFEIGGHSLAAVKLLRRMSDASGMALALTDVFRFPTIRTFARHMASLGRPETSGPVATSPGRRAAEARRAALERRGR